MIAADTSSIIAFLQGDSGKDVDLIEDVLENKQLILPPLVLSEILSDPKLPRKISQIINGFPLLEILPGFWQRVGKTRALLLSKKLNARLADTLITQSCLDHKTCLITRDKDFRHFQKYCGLKIL